LGELLVGDLLAGVLVGSAVPPTPAPTSTATTQPFERRPDAVGTPFGDDGESFAEFDRRAREEFGR
jgi:hypothetical protein